MRNLYRNETTIYYSLYEDSTEQTDSDDLYTGGISNTYAAPVALVASVSAARGTAEIDLFGVNTSYTNAVVVDDPDCPIDENSILWIGISTTEPHNYEVVRVARSLNHVTYAVKQVNFASVSEFVGT